MEIEEKKFREILGEQQEKTERYIGALKEDFDSKLQVVLEQTSVIPEMQQTLNATFEEVGKLRVDMEAVKNIVGDHKVRLQKLEA
jgi:hypothetical protein